MLRFPVARELRVLGVLGVLQPPLLQVLHPLPHVGVMPKKVQNRKRPNMTSTDNEFRAQAT